VANSSISNSTSGAPGGYPSICKGCHWGACTSANGFPIQVSALHTGTVTSSWSTSQPGGGNAYDMAYDVWFSNQGWNTISYSMTSPATSVSNLDIDQLIADAVSRGYIQNSWYLIDVEAGFELCQGGAGLATTSFSVSTGGSSPSPSPSPTATSPPPSPSPTPTGATTFSVTYSLLNSWTGGFQERRHPARRHRHGRLHRNVHQQRRLAFGLHPERHPVRLSAP
jgi:Glycosyl hydrolase family 12